MQVSAARLNSRDGTSGSASSGPITPKLARGTQQSSRREETVSLRGCSAFPSTCPSRLLGYSSRLSEVPLGGRSSQGGRPGGAPQSVIPVPHAGRSPPRVTEHRLTAKDVVGTRNKFLDTVHALVLRQTWGEEEHSLQLPVRRSLQNDGHRAVFARFVQNSIPPRRQQRAQESAMATCIQKQMLDG